MAKAISLLSGGLDSILATRLLQDQEIEILAICFQTPFFGFQKAEKAAAQLKVPLRIIDISEEHIQLVRNPRYGYGRNMNPCIDCHILMLKRAGYLLERENFDFICTGEVMGQRPMSQNKQTLQMVARNSGHEGLILRPLSAKLLSETLPEKEGKVDRRRLLDIRGRSRKSQFELAKRYGIDDFPEPAGGCLLTDPAFSRRLRDILTHQGQVQIRDVELLKVGRHFRLDESTKVIIGRRKDENERLLELAQEGDMIIKVMDYPGPIALIPRGSPKPSIEIAASLCARYSDAPNNIPVVLLLEKGRGEERLELPACSQETCQSLII
ncbi:MAG: tRNA 4-thiouridine(8) synthase ThiI [Syntrophobacterales bacterium]|nr:MAG: tRNA 4-thiouridine(8) synthase ThiI [Syntrophobacterales bacterium]